MAINTSDIIDVQLGNKWNTNRKKKGSNLIPDISLHDENESCNENDDNHDGVKYKINNPINANKRSSVITQLNPEKNIMPHVLVNSKYANITKEGNPCMIN